MLKYYLAEAVLTKQSIFISSADESTEKLLKVKKKINGNNIEIRSDISNTDSLTSRDG